MDIAKSMQSGSLGTHDRVCFWKGHGYEEHTSSGDGGFSRRFWIWIDAMVGQGPESHRTLAKKKEKPTRMRRRDGGEGAGTGVGEGSHGTARCTLAHLHPWSSRRSRSDSH